MNNKPDFDARKAVFHEKTKAYCKTCKINHEARLYEKHNKIFGSYDCPQDGSLTYEIASDAVIYKKIRERCFIDLTREKNETIKPLLAILPITDACNLKCAVCSMNLKDIKNAKFLSVKEILKRADMIKRDEIIFVNLFGGEPTLHPNLFEILDHLKPYHFNISIVSNGLILGRDTSLARELKKRGVSRISISLDSLHEETLKKLGRSYLSEKLKALQYSVEAGHQVQINCMVTKFNVKELPELVQFAADQPPNLFMLSLVSCAPIGHLELEEDKLVGREEMIKNLLGDYRGFSIDMDNFSPPFTFLPWFIEGHPDCGAATILLKHNGKITPINRLLDIDKLYRMAAKNKMKPGYFSQKLLPLLYLFRSIKKGEKMAVFLILSSGFLNKKKFGVLNIGTTNYKSYDFLDMNKISRCGVKIYTSQGPVIGSRYFFWDETYPGSRLNEQLRGAI